MTDTPTEPTNPTFDPYAHYHASKERQEKIYNEAARKALDLADDEMQVTNNVDRSVKGLSATGLATIAAMTGLPPTTIAAVALALSLWRSDPKPETPPPNPPAAAAVDTDTDSAIILLDRPPTTQATQ